MKPTKCLSCNWTTFKDYLYCPRCGAPFDPNEENQFNRDLIALQCEKQNNEIKRLNGLLELNRVLLDIAEEGLVDGEVQRRYDDYERQLRCFVELCDKVVAENNFVKWLLYESRYVAEAVLLNEEAEDNGWNKYSDPNIYRKFRAERLAQLHKVLEGGWAR
jgi:hypothetical protein